MSQVLARGCRRRGSLGFCAFAADHDREVAIYDTVEILGADLHRDVLVRTEVANLAQQIAWVATSHRTSLCLVVILDQVIDDALFVLTLE